jgi:signal peptidase II
MQIKKMHRLKAFRGAWVVPAALVLDRLTKAIAQARAAEVRALIPGLLGFRYARNTGAAFSIFSDTTAILSVVTAIMIAAVSLYLILAKRIPTPARIGLWLVVAGGLGNLYDRVFYGYVVDFLEFLFVRFAIFNIADICVTCGAGLAIVSILIDDMRKGAVDGAAD